MIENHMVIGNYYEGFWDCECEGKPNNPCASCIANDLDYFDEPDSYMDEDEE